MLVHISCDQSSVATCNYCNRMGNWVTAWNHRSFSERQLLCASHMQTFYYLPFMLKCKCGRGIFGRRGPSSTNLPWVGYPLVCSNNDNPPSLMSNDFISCTPANQMFAMPVPVVPPVGDLLPPSYSAHSVITTTTMVTTTISATPSVTTAAPVTTTNLRSLLATPPTMDQFLQPTSAIYSCVHFPHSTRPTMATTTFNLPEPATPIRLAPVTTTPVATAAVFRRNLEDRSRSPLFAHVDRSVNNMVSRIKREPL